LWQRLLQHLGAQQLFSQPHEGAAAQVGSAPQLGAAAAQLAGAAQVASATQAGAAQVASQVGWLQPVWQQLGLQQRLRWWWQRWGLQQHEGWQHIGAAPQVGSQPQP